MALDKGAIKRVSIQCGVAVPWCSSDADHIIAFAQAIYALGVQDERERCAKMCDTIEYDYYRDNKCAEAIRKGK